MSDSLEVLMDLRNRVDLTIKEIETGIGTVYESQVPTSKVGPMVGAHAKFMEDLTGKLDAGKISIDQFDAQVQVGIHDSFTQAYAAGKGVKISDLTDGDVEFLRRASQAEFEFAAKFGRDIESGGLVMSRVDRANMYGGSVNGMAWNGMVEGEADDSRFNWVLGAAEHCEDCITLSISGPYTKWNLPTTPGAGATVCRCVTSPWARVLTKRGSIPIVDVVVGDLVLTHKGRWKKVLATPVHLSESRHHQAWVKAPTGLTVGFTTDHKFFGDEGWLAIGEVAKRRLPMYTVPHEMLKVWNENSKRCEKRNMHNLSSCLPDMRKEEGPQGGRVSFVRYESEGKITMGGPVVSGQDSCWSCSRWEKAAQTLRQDQSPPLYDLTVEDDCSFVVEGLVVHNSNCQCRLTVVSGPLTKDEKAQAAKYGSARDQGVKDMLDISPPKGMRLPNRIEQDYIDSLRNEINFERRKIAQLPPSSKEFKQAVSRRSRLNGELIEFVEQESIFEVPVYSVDEVITAADIGVKAQHDIMLTGLDGGSLDVISGEQLDAMVNRYEKTVGEELPKDSVAAKKSTKKKGKK
jgi:hypothetical protein